MKNQFAQEPIAIVSMACRYPQAENPEQFWELILKGIDTVTEVPRSRWDMDIYYDADKNAHNKSHSRHGAFVESIDAFDPLFFNISPVEAQDMRPEQKMMLELTWQAVERAKIPYSEFEGSHTGVYTGVIWDDFEHVRRLKNAPVTQYSALGQSPNVIAGRVSYFFGLTGPSLNVDTGCSASLVAMQIAVQGLRDGNINMAVVGGLNVILDPGVHVLMSKFGGLSAAGRCFTFDERGDGFVRGEGGAVFLLKRLCDARKDGNKVLALIKAVSVNNNGFNENLPATSAKGQSQMLEMAYREAAIKPEEVDFVEAHGTGTKVGDPNETKALGEFFGVNRPHDRPLRVGSVKTMIGHQEGGAATAGLAKMILAIQNKTYPPNLHFLTPNPLIDFQGLKLKVQTQSEPWEKETGKPRIAGINSFGWVGTNAHIVIEEDLHQPTNNDPQIDREFFVLPISAKTESALKNYVRAYSEHLKENVLPQRTDFYRFCASAALLKPHFDYRAAFVASNKTEMLAQMEEFLSQEYTAIEPIKVQAGKKIVFVFPGQGSQRVGMGRTMYLQEPFFRQVINEFDAAYRPLTGWSLVDEIFADEHKSRLNEIDVVQPVIAAVQCALAKLMIQRGIVPDTVLGHSMGEVAAAYIAGILHIDDAAKIICNRSQLMKTQSGKGAMALTELTYEQAIEQTKRYDNRISVAVSNSPKSTVIAGNTEDIVNLVENLERKGLFARKVNVDVASHSPQMDVLMEPLRAVVNGISPQDTATAYFSPVCDRYMRGSELDTHYWVQNLRQPVQFSSAVSRLLDDKHVLFVEISSNPILTTSIDQCLQPHHEEVVIIDTLRKETHEVLESTRDLADFYCQGCNINFRTIYGDFRNFVDLPAYPWNRAVYALESQSEQAPITSSAFPLLGRKMDLASMAELSFWQSSLSLQNFSFLKGHVVAGRVIFPGAAYLEALIELGSQEFEFFTLNHLLLKEVVLLDQPQSLQLKVQAKSGKSRSVEFFVCNKKFPNWVSVAEAEIEQSIIHKRPEPLPVAGMLYRFALTFRGKEFYEHLQKIHLEYNEQFACVDEVYRLENQCLAKIKPNQHLLGSLAGYKLHPAVLDMAMQTGFALMDIDSQVGDKTAVVESVGKVIFYQKIKPQNLFYAHAINKNKGFRITLLGEDGTLYVEIEDLRLTLVNKERLFDQTSSGIKDWLFTTQWQKRETAGRQFHRRKAVHTPQKWVIFGPAQPLSQYLRENQLQVFQVYASDHYLFDFSARSAYISASDPEHHLQLFGDLAQHGWHDIEAVVHAFALTPNEPTTDELPLQSILDNQQLGTLSLMCLAQVLKSNGLRPMVSVLTRMAQPVAEFLDSKELNISAFPLWAMARTFANEFPDLECRRFDIEGHNWKEVYLELVHGDLNEKEVAFRGKQQFVSRLINYYDQIEKIEDNIRFDSLAVYLITGFRGLASIFAQWMFERGARNFVLTSRSGTFSAKFEEKCTSWRTQGANISIIKADMSQPNDVERVFENIREAGLPLKGIVHAAGLAEAGLLAQLSKQDFDKITAPKIAGTWLLHQHSLSHPIEWFVLFSSPTIFFGTNGQGHYVAGNMFLDAVAQYRHSIGLPAISVNWGLVTEVGMAADVENIDRYARQEGFEPIKMAEAVEVFGKVFDKNQVHIGILKLNIEQLKNYYPVWANSNFLLSVSSSQDKRNENSDVLSLMQKLNSKQEKVLALEEFLKLKLSKLLKIQPSDLKPSAGFKNLGVDSITAVQFRSQIDKALNLKLPISAIWNYPTLGQFAEFLYMELAGGQPTAESQHKFWKINQPRPNAKRKIFCFHGAGQSASMFWSWNIDEQIELYALELPGRDTAQTLLYDNFAELIDQISKELVTLLDKPFAFFGHSFGGLLAYETLKRLVDSNSSLPIHFFVSASLPPFLVESKRVEVIEALADDNLGKYFPELEGLGDSDLKQLTINLLKNDFKLIEAYLYDPYPLFDVRVSAFAATNDLLIQKQDVEQWSKITNKDFTCYELNEHHNFIDTKPELVVEVLNGNWQ